MLTNRITVMDSRKKHSLFKSIYELYLSPLTFFAMRYVTREVGEDIVQGIFMKLWDSPIELKKETVKSYLFLSVRNSCLDYLKHQGVKNKYKTNIINLGIEIRDDDFTEKSALEEKLLKLAEDVERLPNRGREIFKLAYFDSLKIKDIADRLGMSKRTVETHLYRSLKFIKSKHS